MRDRVLAFILALSFLAAALAAEVQPAAKGHRIGYLTAGPPATSAFGLRVYRAFVDGLRERGWVEGSESRLRAQVHA